MTATRDAHVCATDPKRPAGSPPGTTHREDRAPRISAELFVIPIEQGKYLVYAPLRRAAFVANARLVNLLGDLQHGVHDDQVAGNRDCVDFLRRLEILDAGSEPLPITEFGNAPEPTAVTLFLTTACNLRCTYCYASAGDTPTRYMPLAVARRGIDFVAGNAQRNGTGAFEVAYHGGGEPSVHWSVMTESLAYARRKAHAGGLTVSASAATNGMLNDRQIDWIIANLSGVSLSFDGLPSTNDQHRLTVGGKGSSQRVMRTMRRYDAAGFPYGVRVTVTRDQIPALAESVAFICGEFHPSRIQVEPAYQIGRWHQAPSAETQEFIDAYREAQSRAAAHGCEITYSAARLDTLTNHFCGITQDNFCLTPDGNVSACYETFSEQNTWAKVFFYGKPDARGHGYQFDLGKLEHLRGQAVQHRPYCRGCFAKWHCAGDCYHKSLTVGGESEFSGSDRCHITRELTKDLILAQVARAGGLFWHEPPQDVSPHAAGRGKEVLS